MWMPNQPIELTKLRVSGLHSVVWMMAWINKRHAREYAQRQCCYQQPIA